MGSAVEKDTTLGSPSGVLDVPQQTINDSTVTTEARTAAKRRHDELEERQNELGSSQAEERNVRRKEGPSTPHKLAKTLPHEGNGQTQSPDHPSSEPDSPCSFRTAHSNSDHGPMSPTLEQNMDVDTENTSPQPAYSPPEDSREQNIAQTLSNLADTIRHPSSSSSHPHGNAPSSHQLQDGAPEQQPPQTSQTVVSGTGADPSGPSANGPRITRSFLAAAAAAAREAEGLAASQGSNGAPAATHSTGFESLAQAINAAQQPLLPSEATNDNSAASQPTHTTSKPSGPAPLQVNANVSPNATVPTNGTEATQASSLPVNPVVRVAEAAVAAQKAAASSSQSVTPASSSPPPPSASSTTETSPSQTGPSASPQTTPNPALASNPYAITTQYLKSPTATPTSPGLPMSPLAMNPYAMYYGPGTPTTPGYSPYMSPYYYMGAPMPSPNGVYPPGPSLPPTPASASAPPGGPSQQLPPPQRQGSGSDVRVAKPKRLKAHTVTSKSFSIPMVPRDKHGNPMLPLNVGIMTVHSLGSVCMREHFHTERYIFPVGYDVTRRYLSTIDPTHEVVYHCTILDGGDGPKFQIIPSDVPDRPVIAGTATGAWSSIVKQANMIRNRQHSNSVSGPDFFGLGQNTIKHLIQELPNARNLRDYVWQNFQEGGPLGGRHAAVIPALPEEYDGGLAVGNYYQGKLKRDVTSTPDSPKGLGYYPQHVQAEARRPQPSPPQPPVAGPSQIAPQPSNGTGQPPVSPPHQQPLQIHAHSMAEIAQALSNQAQAQAQAVAVASQQQQQQQTPLDARQAMQYSNARSQPPVNAPYNPDPGIPPGGNPTGQGVPNTFASIMNAFPAGVPPAGVPPTQP